MMVKKNWEEKKWQQKFECFWEGKSISLFFVWTLPYLKRRRRIADAAGHRRGSFGCGRTFLGPRWWRSWGRRWSVLYHGPQWETTSPWGWRWGDPPAVASGSPGWTRGGIWYTGGLQRSVARTPMKKRPRKKILPGTQKQSPYSENGVEQFKTMVGINFVPGGCSGPAPGSDWCVPWRLLPCSGAACRRETACGWWTCKYPTRSSPVRPASQAPVDRRQTASILSPNPLEKGKGGMDNDPKTTGFIHRIKTSHHENNFLYSVHHQ